MAGAAGATGATIATGAVGGVAGGVFPFGAWLLLIINFKLIWFKAFLQHS